MEDFTLTNLPSYPPATQVMGMEYWEKAMLYDMEMMMLKPVLEKLGAGFCGQIDYFHFRLQCREIFV